VGSHWLCHSWLYFIDYIIVGSHWLYFGHSPINIQVGTSDAKEEYLLIGPVEPVGSDRGSHESPQTGLLEGSHDSQSEIGTHPCNCHVNIFVLVPMSAILEELHVATDDRSCLFAVCLLDGMISNYGN